MLWKIYFWIFLISSIIGFLFETKDISNFKVEWAGVVTNIALVIPIYSVTFTKQVFSKKWWRIIFWSLIMYFFIGNVIIGGETNIFKASTEEIILLSFFLPAFYAIYKLSYK